MAFNLVSDGLQPLQKTTRMDLWDIVGRLKLNPQRSQADLPPSPAPIPIEPSPTTRMHLRRGQWLCAALVPREGLGRR